MFSYDAFLLVSQKKISSFLSVLVSLIVFAVFLQEVCYSYWE